MVETKALHDNKTQTLVNALYGVVSLVSKAQSIPLTNSKY